MKITKIEIKNFLSFKFCALKLKTNSNTILMSGNASKIKWQLIQAISLIMSPMYENILEVANLIGNPRSGYVKLNFIIKDDKTGNFEELIALRYFDYSDYILYSFRGTFVETLVANFHQKFQINSPLLCFNQRIGKSILYPKQILLEQVLTKHARISRVNQQSAKSMENLLLMDNMTHVLMEMFSMFDYNEKKEVFYVTKMVANLFHFLTFEKHKVVFYLPCFQKIESEQLSFLDLYFDYLTAHIVYENQNEVLWHKADNLLKQLYEISVKIIMASIYDIKTIFLNDLCEINFNQHCDLVMKNLNRRSSINEDETNFARTTDDDEKCINYIQRIIHACKDKEMTVFINVNVINYQSLNSANILWFNEDKIELIEDDLKDISKIQFCKDFSEFIGDGSNTSKNSLSSWDQHKLKNTTQHFGDSSKRPRSALESTSMFVSQPTAQRATILSSANRTLNSKINIISNVLVPALYKPTSLQPTESVTEKPNDNNVLPDNENSIEYE